MAAWRYLVKVMHENGGGPFTTRQLEDKMYGQELTASTTNPPAGLGLIVDMDPGRHGRDRRPRWMITSLGEDFIAGRVVVDYEKKRGMFYGYFVRHSWLSPLPRAGQGGMESAPQFSPPVFRDPLEINARSFTGYKKAAAKSLGSAKPIPNKAQTAILFTDAHAAPSTVVPTNIPPADTEESGPLEEYPAGEYPCLQAQTKLKAPSRSSAGNALNHPWRPRFQPR